MVSTITFTSAIVAPLIVITVHSYFCSIYVISVVKTFIWRCTNGLTAKVWLHMHEKYTYFYILRYETSIASYVKSLLFTTKSDILSNKPAIERAWLFPVIININIFNVSFGFQMRKIQVPASAFISLLLSSAMPSDLKGRNILLFSFIARK